jgi:hypothetical protein
VVQVSLLLAAALAAVPATSDRSPTSPVSLCAASTVHYTATRVGTPWIRANGITGHLFAYGGRTLMDERVNASDGVVLYVRGGTGDPAMKVLWATSRGTRRLTVRGIRLDGSGSFMQQFGSAGGGQFPSIVSIPTAGCWRLAVRSGSRRATFVVRALEPPTESMCHPTAVLRHTPHPRFGNVTWMPARPRSSGIVAVLFVSTLPGAESAVVYAGGRAPEGWSTKFLWWSPRPGSSLELKGRRMDLIGTFDQSERSAIGIDPPVTGPVFPSIVTIPAAGCWAVTVSTGGRAGMVVFQSVVTG